MWPLNFQFCRSVDEYSVMEDDSQEGASLREVPYQNQVSPTLRMPPSWQWI